MFGKRLGIVWLVLSAITVAQFLGLSLGGAGAYSPNATLTVSVILVSLIKVRLILMEFMEVRHAPALLCRLTDIWLVVTAVALLGAYFGGSQLWAR